MQQWGREMSRMCAVLIAMSVLAGCSSPESEPVYGQMVVSYEDATTPAASQGRSLMQKARVLDDMADYLNEYLKLPYPIEFVGAQCDEPNAFWSAADRRITVCYEFADLFLTMFETNLYENVTDPTKAAVNATLATAYHELGQALISIYDLPATGRLEDAADQLSVYMWLVPDDNIKNDAPEVVEDFAEMLKRLSTIRGDLVDEDFAGEHSLDLTRMYNLACWVYGSDPIANADVVARTGLPQARADRCPFEFQQIVKAWHSLLAPHVR